MQKITESVQQLISHLHRPVAFEPIAEDNDELTQAISNDVHTHENDWQLKEEPDAEKLGAFWDNVLAELEYDVQESKSESSE